MWFRRQAQIIFQDPLSSLSPRLTVSSLLAEPLKIHGRDREARMRRACASCMAAVSLSEALLDKYPHQVSGGQARRVGIARALVLNPRLVVADEPTAGLDVSIQGDLLNLLADLQEKFGLTYLMVSHNLNVVRKVTDRVAVMYLGKIVEIGRTATVFSAPAHPYSARSDQRQSGDRPGEAAREGRAGGRDPEPARSAVRLPLPHALPARAGALPRRGAAAAADGRRPLGRLPLPAGGGRRDRALAARST